MFVDFNILIILKLTGFKSVDVYYEYGDREETTIIKRSWNFRILKIFEK